MITDYFKLAFGNLRHRGLRSWLTILGIFIGIAAVVSLISLGAGLERAVTGQFGALSVDKLTIQNKGSGFGPPGSTVVEKLNDGDVDIVGSVSGVEEVVPRLIRVVRTEYNDVAKFAYVADIPRDKRAAEIVYDSFNVEVAEGKLLEAGETGRILIGSDIARESNYGREVQVGKDINVAGKDFEVVGILERSSSFQVNSVIMISNEDLEDILDIDNEYDLIVAQVHNQDEIESIAEDIERKLRQDRNEDLGDETFTVETPLESLAAVTTILNIINLIVIGIAAISLIVGGVGIANTMYTSVVERTKEIGIMKAIGAQNRDILFVFLIESGLLGLVGGIVGALIGLGAALGIAAIANQALGESLFIVSPDYTLLIGSVLFSFILGIIFGVFPARQASKLNVVEAIRK